MTPQPTPQLFARLVHPPEAHDERDDRDEHEDGGGNEGDHAYCLREGSKSSAGRRTPARSIRSLKRGRTPVARWKPRIRPSASMPCCSNTKMSCVVMTSSSMPTISVTLTSLRAPSLRRA